MSTRRAKQLLYGTFYAIIWGVFFTIIYFIFLRQPPAPVLAIPCAVDCLPMGATPFATQGDISAFTTSAGHVTFLASIANSNSNYGAASFNYSFNLYDATGASLGSVTGQSFIYPGEQKYIIDPNVSVPAGFDHATFAFSGVQWVSSDAIGFAPQFTFQNIMPRAASGTIAVGGEIVNNDVAVLHRVDVVTIFTGSSGAPIGASETEVNE